ncbi:MAG: NAD-dependent protein deacetylase [Chromatiales bacterium]
MTEALDDLVRFAEDHPRLCVLTGAGISTGSGIPDYRDRSGAWKRPAPVQYRDFLAGHGTRQRYWARSLVGWRWFEQARPNGGHRALACLERCGRVDRLITQNVDRLHQRAGSERVVDLHGRLDRVTCLGCGAMTARASLQARLAEENPAFARLEAAAGPDGDANVGALDFGAFRVPDCEVCGGILKPDVVFFGEGVPRHRVVGARTAVLASDALLVVGSSLMVYSGFRFCRLARDHGLPIAAVNLGRTRADELFDLKLHAECTTALDTLAAALGACA